MCCSGTGDSWTSNSAWVDFPVPGVPVMTMTGEVFMVDAMNRPTTVSPSSRANSVDPVMDRSSNGIHVVGQLVAVATRLYCVLRYPLGSHLCFLLPSGSYGCTTVTAILSSHPSSNTLALDILLPRTQRPNEPPWGLFLESTWRVRRPKVSLQPPPSCRLGQPDWTFWSKSPPLSLIAISTNTTPGYP